MTLSRNGKTQSFNDIHFRHKPEGDFVCHHHHDRSIHAQCAWSMQHLEKEEKNNISGKFPGFHSGKSCLLG